MSDDHDIAKPDDHEARARSAAAVASADAEAAVVHAEGVDDEPVVSNQRMFSGPVLIGVSAIAAIFAAFHLFSLNVSDLILETWNYRMVHIAGALALGFLIYGGARFSGEGRGTIGRYGAVTIYAACLLGAIAVAGAGASFFLLQDANWSDPNAALMGVDGLAFTVRAFGFKLPLILAALTIFFAGAFYDATPRVRTFITIGLALCLGAIALDYAAYLSAPPAELGRDYFGPLPPLYGFDALLLADPALIESATNPSRDTPRVMRFDAVSFATLILLIDLVRRGARLALSELGRRRAVQIGAWVALALALLALGTAFYFNGQISDGLAWNGADKDIAFNEIYYFGVPLLIATFTAIVLSWFHQTDRTALNVTDIVLALSGAAVAAYLISIYGTNIRQSTGTPYAPIGISLAATAGAALILEITRRVAGLALVVIAALFLGYVFVGDYMPGILNYESPSWARFFSQVYTDAGILGPTTAVSSTYIILFIIFAAFLQASKVGDYFVNFAFATAGRARGGPAKVAVFASGLMGMINGTSAGNVVATGSLTIPLMKKVGYPPKNAGAIEAAASTGGQIMPPIMGAGAFIMAEITEIPYIDITIAAIIPAVLYFASILFMIDLQAVRLGMRGMRREELPQLSKMLRQIYLFVPIIILIYALFAGYSVIRAGAYATGAAVIVSWIAVLLSWLAPGSDSPTSRAELRHVVGQQIILSGVALIAAGAYFAVRWIAGDGSGDGLNPTLVAYLLAGLIAALLVLGYDVYRERLWPAAKAERQSADRPIGMGPIKVMRAFQLAGVMSIQIIAVCAAAGVIVGVISITGVGQRFSGFLLALAESSQLLALFFAMCIAILLGMGMPTTAAYAVAASVVAPGLIELGIEKLTAHFFVFYFAVISAITPPVALASYAAAGISGSNAMSTSVASFKIGLAAFIVPFMFFYNTTLLMEAPYIDLPQEETVVAGNVMQRTVDSLRLPPDAVAIVVEGQAQPLAEALPESMAQLERLSRDDIRDALRTLDISPRDAEFVISGSTVELAPFLKESQAERVAESLGATPEALSTDWFALARSLLTALIGVYLLSAAVEGFMLSRRLPVLSRVLLLGAAVLMIEGGILTDAVGVASAAAAIGLQRLVERRGEGMAAPA